MGIPVYAVCERCVFLRAFAASSGDGKATPRHCPACGQEVTVHGREERYPSTYVGRVARELLATPPLRV
jgi:hypothetical protein